MLIRDQAEGSCERFRLKQGYKIMMEAEAAGKSMMEAEAVRQPAEAGIMLLPAAEAEIIDLVPLLKARIFPRARSLVPYKHIILHLELP